MKYRYIDCEVCGTSKRAFVEIPTKSNKILICGDCMEELTKFGVHVELELDD
jgi:ribosome-binding protein aMBF1 (putative translation factor)